MVTFRIIMNVHVLTFFWKFNEIYQVHLLLKELRNRKGNSYSGLC